MILVDTSVWIELLNGKLGTRISEFVGFAIALLDSGLSDGLREVTLASAGWP